jgi:hypothetical protein
MEMFTRQSLRDLLSKKPFVPFRLWLTDGVYVDVPTTEVVMAGRHWVVVGLLDPKANDDVPTRWTTVWYLHVSRVEMLAPGAPPFSQPPDNGNLPSPATV